MGNLPSFRQVLDELDALQIKKGKDYGSDEDPLANIRASEGFGVAAWLGAIIRLNDKVNRVKSFAKRGKLENESLEDSLIDMAVYAIHALRLYRESLGPYMRPFCVGESIRKYSELIGPEQSDNLHAAGRRTMEVLEKDFFEKVPKEEYRVESGGARAGKEVPDDDGQPGGKTTASGSYPVMPDEREGGEPE